jgi:hypothetical protein
MSVKHPELVLAGAVAVCLPMVPGLLKGQISDIAAAERFLIALVVCWVLGSVLSWVIRTYSAQASRAELTRMVDESRAGRAASSAGDTERSG